MLHKVFIANRGEIAVRVARACRALGIPSVAAYSEADAGAEHVRAADEAVCVGGPEAAASYLDVAAIVAAAQSAGCDSIHPGYGFLAENGNLAQACAEAGLTFIGPTAEVLRLLGDKVQSRTTMQAAGVPVVPGTFEASEDLETLQAAAAEVGVPLLIKATGGGGGTGMRRVDRDEDVPAALAEATAEAAAAFGNPALYVEKLVEDARHVEIQILADGETVVTLGERECSVQRRHQKVIEESPSPAVDPALRERMCDAARKAGEAAGYVGAGTVEFLLGPDGAFYFLEVNARIQVEHPITEERFGVDLVAWQLRIAGGEALDPALAGIEPRGWAMEARLYAEDPATGFLPSAGTLTALELPAGPGIRVDAGVIAGSDVPMYYDPILAKLIAWGEDREQCRRRLRDALAETVVLGVAHNAAFLRDVLDHPAFVGGATHTRVLEETIVPDLAEAADGHAELAAIAAAWALETLPAAGAAAAGGGARAVAVPGPWALLDARYPGGGE